MTHKFTKSLIAHQQLNNILGCSLSSQDFKNCCQKLKHQSPPIGKIWQANEAGNGLYIIIAGKVRLLSHTDQLVATIKSGSTFGELTVLPQLGLLPYVVRASINVQLLFLPAEALLPLMEKYRDIRAHLEKQARSHNSQLIQLTSNADGVGRSEKQLKGEKERDFRLKPSPFTPDTLDPSIKLKQDKKISNAYFPSPAQRVGHLWQRMVRRYPFLSQQSTSDCGAACLAMVSLYWGRRFSINRLRVLANVDRNGASLRGLAAAAESVGFATRPVKANFKQLAQQTLPAIVHWEGKHYIVVYKMTRTQVIVADPAIGQRTISHREFNHHWTGYALLCHPTVLLQGTQESINSFWQFLELIKPHSLVLIEIFIASLFIQIFGLVTPLFTQLLFDRVVVQGSVLTLTTVGLGLLLFGLFRVAITCLRQYLLDHTAQKVDLALMVGFIRHTFHLPPKLFRVSSCGRYSRARSRKPKNPAFPDWRGTVHTPRSSDCFYLYQLNVLVQLENCRFWHFRSYLYSDC